MKSISFKFSLIFPLVLFSFSIYVFADILPWRPIQQASTDSAGSASVNAEDDRLIGDLNWNISGNDAYRDSESVGIGEKPAYTLSVNGLRGFPSNSIVDTNTLYADKENSDVEIGKTPDLSYKLDGGRQTRFKNDLSTTDGGTKVSGGKRTLAGILFSDGIDLSGGKLPLADILNKLIPHYIREFGKNAPGFIKRTNFSVNFQEDLEPLWSVETVQPLYQTPETLRHTIFFQGRYAHDKGNNSDTDTMNLGIGYRYIHPGERWMAGINSF